MASKADCHGLGEENDGVMPLDDGGRAITVFP